MSEKPSGTSQLPTSTFTTALLPAAVTMVTGSISRVGGGVSTAVHGLATGLQTRGSRVRILSQQDAHSLDDLHDWAGLDVALSPILGPKRYAFSWQNQRAMANNDCDVVHLHGLWTGSSLQSLAWASRGHASIISPHGMLDDWAMRHSSITKRAYWLLLEATNLARARCIHALSASEAEAVRALGIEVPVAVIPNGIDITQADAPLPFPPWHTIVPEGARVLLFFGRLHPKKGLDLVIKALAVQRAGTRQSFNAAPLHLVVAGPGPRAYLAELEKLVAELGLGAHVSFVGPQYGLDKRASLAAADAFILPSYSEGLPMAVLEAWAFRLPVIMTRACNLEIGFAAEAALEISTSVGEIAAALDTLSAMTPGDLQVMGFKGHSLAAQEFSWVSVAERMAELYSWAAGGGSAPNFLHV